MHRTIAISGYARSGKDTIADYLVDLGFQRHAFADVLRDCVEALNPIIYEDRLTDALVRYRDVLEDIGYEKGKETYAEFREVLQRMGTEVGRNILGQNIWVDITLNRINISAAPYHVITDCRFPNEADGVRRAGGSVWRVERPGVGPANDHISEHALEGYDFDVVLHNDGTIEDLYAKVRELLNG